MGDQSKTDVKHSGRRRRAVVSVIVLAVVALSVGAIVAFGAIRPEEQPAVTYPRVDGDLGTHLEQLQRSVER